MTDAQLKQALRAIGFSLRKRDGEYRVNFTGGGEATAYYTDDRADALDTARAMDRHARADHLAPITLR